MRRRSPASEDDRLQVVAIERDELGRQQVVSDHHGVLWEREVHRPRLTGERKQHVRLYVEQIVCPLTQARIVKQFERRDGGANCQTPRKPGAFSGGDVFVSRFVEHGVVEKREMRLCDFAPGRAAGASDARQPCANDLTCTFEICTLVRRAPARFGHYDLSTFEAGSASDGKSRHCDDSGQCSRVAG